MRTKTDQGWGHLYRFTAKGLAKVNLNAYESKILWAIIYKTVCFNKESDEIPESQFEDLTRINRWNHKRPINGLIKKGVIWRKGNEYGLCKRYLLIEDVSDQIQKEEDVSDQRKNESNQIQKTYSTRYTHKNSHKNSHKRGLSASQREEKRKVDKKGLAMLKGAIGKFPDRKRKNH